MCVDELLEPSQRLRGSRPEPRKICLDVGIGFGKTLAHNMALLAALKAFVDLPYAHLMGVSAQVLHSKGHGQTPRPAISTADQSPPPSMLMGRMPSVPRS